METWNDSEIVKPEDYKRVLVVEFFADWAPIYKEAFYSSNSNRWYDKDGDDDFGSVPFWTELPPIKNIPTNIPTNARTSPFHKKDK